MTYTIRDHFHIELHGFSAVAADGNWGKMGMQLMDRMWKEVRSGGLQNKGLNVWVYGPGNTMFCGVELIGSPPVDSGLGRMEVSLPRYVYYKHIGSYDRIKESGLRVSEEARQAGIKTGLPYLEIYGHWTEDVSKLETELLWALID
jgi:hypothetical protein